jgi:4-amino-4-deoxy-L-arabinose transferase-like glycosyltransferase
MSGARPNTTLSALPAWILGAEALRTETPAPTTRRFSRAVIAAMLALVLALSAFLQFYRLNDLQHFQGDEGILVLAARALIVAHQFPAHGLALATGHAHIGPLFDYLIVPPLWLFGLNPTAAVALNGASQVLAVALCYALIRRYTGSAVAGLAGAVVSATAQEVVYYGRFLWPNMLPCLVLLIFWSLLAWSDGRDKHCALLGIWLGTALQLQPTAVLLIPFTVLYLVLFRPPLPRLRYPLLGIASFLALFAPAIVEDLTHGLVETKAWLEYSDQGSATNRALGPTFSRLGVLLQRLVGLHQSELALGLGLLFLTTLLRVMLPGQVKGRTGIGNLTAMLLLYCLVMLAGYIFYGSQLKPHYIMPLFPIPGLLLGVLAVPWSGLRPITAGVWRAAVMAIAITLAIVNVRQTWAANFLLDRYQITISPRSSNLITLEQMRQVSSFITRQADGRAFNLLFTAPDDGPEAYTALLLSEGARVSGHHRPLRFLIVQPADWQVSRWPPWARVLAACDGARERRFMAARVWMIRGTCTATVRHGNGG